MYSVDDLVAWTANAHIDRRPYNPFAHTWYEEHLSTRDPHRSPRLLSPRHSKTP